MPRYPNRTWITGSGHLIPVSEMSNDHLRNTLNFIQTRSSWIRARAVTEYWQATNTAPAMRVVNSVEVSRILMAPLNEVFPPFQWMLEEAAHRGWSILPWAGNVHETSAGGAGEDSKLPEANSRRSRSVVVNSPTFRVGDTCDSECPKM